MPDHYISPRFLAAKASPGEFADWVDIYEDRVWGWCLAHAVTLAGQDKDSALAGIHLALSCIEPYEVYRRGESSDGRSKEFFKAGFRRIFANFEPKLDDRALEAVAESVYKEVRCGLFHDGITGTRVFIVGDVAGIEVGYDPTTQSVRFIRISAAAFVKAVVAEFREFVRRLRDERDSEYQELRTRFEAAWHLSHRPG